MTLFADAKREIIRMRFGSHLYGTSTPASDTDIKAVYIPCARDILLQRVKGTISTKREKAHGERNVAGDVDEETFSLQRYLQLVSEGQTVALDMLFAPSWAWVGPASPIWSEITRQRGRLISRRAAAFVGYCRTQANRYGVRGSRVSAARRSLEFLKDAVSTHGGAARLESAREEAIALAALEHVNFIPRDTMDPKSVDFLEVCGRKLAFTASLSSAHDTVKRIVDEYGHRALAAERNEGVDWKALSHAVRVGSQAIELLGTGHITFPLPNAAHVLAVKSGKIPFQQVGAEIEDLMDKVTAAEASSRLPERPDLEWIDGVVAEVYGGVISPLPGGRNGLEDTARTVATVAHEAIKQVRRYTGEPYINHPAAVAEIVRSVPHTPEMLAAAWLHDVVEDTGVTISLIRGLFGCTVGDLVDDLTDPSKPEDGNRETRRAIDRAHSARASSHAKTIKLADIIDNTKAIATHDPNFARVYIPEMERLLEVLKEGNPKLYARAVAAVAEARMAITQTP